MSNPYDVERSWPDYFLEHRRETVEKQGTYQAGDLPVWTIYCPLGCVGNSIVIDLCTIDEAIVAMGRGPLAIGTAASQLGPHETARVAAIHRRAGFDGICCDPTAVRHAV